MIKQKYLEENAESIKKEIERLSKEMKNRTGENLLMLMSYIEGMKYVL